MSEAKAVFEEWIAAVAGAVESLIGRYAPRPRIVLSGESTGVVTASVQSMRNGSRPSDISFRISDGRPNPSDRKSVV